MERAAQGNFAYISWKTYQQDIIARNFVDSEGRRRVYQVNLRVWLDQNTTLSVLLKAKTVFNTPAYLAWAFPPGSDLRPEFNRIIRRLLEVKLL